MKTLHITVIIGIVIMGMIITSYEIVQNSVRDAKLGCTDPEQADLQYDVKRLAIRQQVKSIILAYPETRNLIDDSTYCEFMSTTSYTQNGTYQGININLNNTKNLIAQVSLQNNSVVSYELLNLTRTYPAP